VKNGHCRVPSTSPCADVFVDSYRCLLRAGGESLFGGADASTSLSAVASGLARPLQPALGDSAALCAGPALLALLAAAPAAVGPAIPALLSAIAGKVLPPNMSV